MRVKFDPLDISRLPDASIPARRPSSFAGCSPTVGPQADHAAPHARPGSAVNRFIFEGARWGAIALALSCLAACGTQPAKDFRGGWKPVNRFQDKPSEIPLERPYTFYASPMDETLKTMLGRWASDTGRTLRYRLDYDVTLFTPVSDIHTDDLAQAADRLNTIYAAQGVHVTGYPREIVVEAPAAASADDLPKAAPTGSVPPATASQKRLRPAEPAR